MSDTDIEMCRWCSQPSTSILLDDDDNDIECARCFNLRRTIVDTPNIARLILETLYPVESRTEAAP